MSCAKGQIGMTEGKMGAMKGPMRRYKDGNNNNNSVKKMKSSGSSRPARMKG